MPREKQNETRNVYLRYEFKPEEKVEITNRLVENISKKSALEDDKKSSMSDFKHRIDAVEGEINRETERLKSGYEMRNIECDVYLDFEADEKITIRKDTGEEVERIRIPEEDRQTVLGDDELNADDQQPEPEEEPIRSMYEFANYSENKDNSGAYYRHKFMHFSWLLSMQYHFIHNEIKRGVILRAVKLEENND